MKRRKQILAVILAGVMTVPMAIPAQAAEIQDSIIEETAGEDDSVELQDETEEIVQDDSQAGADDIIVEESSEVEDEVTGNRAGAQEKIHLSFEENLTDNAAVHTVIARSGDGSEKQAVYTEGVKSGTKAIEFDGSTYLDMGTTPDLTPAAMTGMLLV